MTKENTSTIDLETGNIEFKPIEDRVNEPKYYKLDGLDIESIDVIKAVLGDGFKAFCKGNILKYMIRADKKNGVEDLKKAEVYLNWLLESEDVPQTPIGK